MKLSRSAWQLLTALAWLAVGSSVARAQVIRSFANPESATSCENLFGSTAVAASDSLVAIAAAGATVGGKPRAGRVYVFDAHSGALVRAIEEPTPAAQHFFGAALAVAADRVAIGETAPGTAAYLFDGRTGALLRTLDASAVGVPPFTQPFDGEQMAFAGDDLLIASGGPALLFDGASGQLLQTFRGDASMLRVERLAATATSVVLSGRDAASHGVVDVFDAVSGALRWRFASSGQVSDPGFAALLGANVAVADPLVDGGIVHVLSGASGAELRRFGALVPSASSGFGQPLVVAGGRVVAGGAPNRGLNVVDGTSGVLRTVLGAPAGGPLVGATGGTTFLVAGFPEQETEDPCAPVTQVASDATCDPAVATECGFCSACVANVGCVSGPRTGCRKPTTREAASLVIQDKADDKQDSFGWKWTRGSATTIEDFFGGRAASELALCVYDAVPAAPELVLGAGIGCGATSCWKLSGKDWSLTSQSGSGDGVKSAKLHAGGDGSSQIAVTAGGAALETPRLPLSPGVVVQLQSPDGACWDASFSRLKSNTTKQLQAKSD